MRRAQHFLWLTAILVGCQTSAKAPYADSPLLMSREPLKQTAAASKTPTAPNVAQSMPVLAPSASVRRTPPTKNTALNKPPIETSNKAAEIQQVVATSTPSAIAPVVWPELTEAPKAVPLPVPPSPPAQMAAVPAIPMTPVPRYAHAPDYAWLVGEVDVHYRGHKELRFCSMTDENALGGKVRLVDHLQLADLKAGTHVRIEGELVRDDPTAVAGEYPRYHIRNIQVIDRPTK